MKRAFTLIEINMAMGILAMGVMVFVGLYSFGYREANQGREDVEATAVADYVLGQLAAAASSTNVTWSNFRKLGRKGSVADELCYPKDSWMSYLGANYLPAGNPTSIARKAFSDFLSDLGVSGGFKFPEENFGGEKLEYGLVILHKQDSPIVRIGFRATKVRQLFMTSSVFYTEAMFQGVSK